MNQLFIFLITVWIATVVARIILWRKMRAKHINVKRWQLIWWGKFPKFKKGTYTPTTPIFDYWYFGMFEVRKFRKI